MANNNSANQDYQNNSDGAQIGGGATKRILKWLGADITLTGSGSNTYTFPSTTDTLLGRNSTDTITNKTIDGDDNTLQDIASPSLKSTVAFYVYRSTAWTTTNGSSKVLLNSEVFDEGSNFDITTNNRFIAPYDGLYHFDGGVFVNNGTSRRAIALLYVNGNLYASGSSIDSTFPGSTVSATIKLAATDYVELYFTCNTATTGGTGQNNTYLSGHMIGKY